MSKSIVFDPDWDFHPGQKVRLITQVHKGKGWYGEYTYIQKVGSTAVVQDPAYRHEVGFKWLYITWDNHSQNGGFFPSDFLPVVQDTFPEDGEE